MPIIVTRGIRSIVVEASSLLSYFDRSRVRVCHRHCPATKVHEAFVSGEVDLSHAQFLLVDPLTIESRELSI